MSVIDTLIILGSIAAAVLAWAAKLQWSKEFKEAKEAQVRALKGQIDSLRFAHEERLKAKDEQIATLEKKLKSFHDLNSEKIREFFEYTKSQLESYNDNLASRVKELEDSIEDKEKLIRTFSKNQSNHEQELEVLKSQKVYLQAKLESVEREKINVEAVEVAVESAGKDHSSYIEADYIEAEFLPARDDKNSIPYAKFAKLGAGIAFPFLLPFVVGLIDAEKS
ncbi:MAG: hypothetical protein F6J95_033310 [Leptolyngbya sp. SIO1E4]|nr:hypothetical protein [Leptolyngbya sp. SIO1E4]